LRVHADVEDIVPSNEDVSVVRDDVRVDGLSGLLKDDIHVVVASNHLAAIFDVILQLHYHIAIEAMHQDVERTFGRLQKPSPSWWLMSYSPLLKSFRLIRYGGPLAFRNT